MSSDLAAELDELSPELGDELGRYGFERGWFLEQAEKLRRDGRRVVADNRVSGEVSEPASGDVVDLPPSGSPERAQIRAGGEEELAAGRCALVLLAGGMATRMGGVVKSLVDAVPGKSFLELRLEGQEFLEQEYGHEVPLWLMTSHATDEPIRQALGDRLDGYRIATFPQQLSLRLTPDGDLFRDDEGRPSEHAPGHGDFPEALRRSGLLHEFIERGGRHVTMANIDNLGATLDPLLVGMHVQGGSAVTCEVVDKVGSDRGGIPARVDGRPVILEEFRIPDSFDPARVRVFNTNTFHFDAPTLRDLEMDWTYFVVEKEVDGRPAIQFERLVNEVTFHLDTIYLRVPREGPESRFLPVKDRDDLEERRPDLDAVARDRGMLGG